MGIFRGKPTQAESQTGTHVNAKTLGFLVTTLKPLPSPCNLSGSGQSVVTTTTSSSGLDTANNAEQKAFYPGLCTKVQSENKQ